MKNKLDSMLKNTQQESVAPSGFGKGGKEHGKHAHDSRNKRYKKEMERRRRNGLPLISYKEWMSHHKKRIKGLRKKAFGGIVSESGRFDKKRVKRFLASRRKRKASSMSVAELKQDVLRGLKAQQDWEKGVKFESAEGDKKRPQWLQALVDIGKSAAGELINRGADVPSPDEAQPQPDETKTTIMGLPKPVAIGGAIVLVSLTIYGIAKLIKK